MSVPVHPLLPEFRADSPARWWALGLLIYLGLIIGVLALAPPGLPKASPSAALVTFGIVGLWRWSWAGLHLARSLVYSYLVFPRIRRAASRAPRPPALYALVTSYRMQQELNAAVYARLLDEVAAYGVPAFIVACVTDPADAAVIEALLTRRHDLPEGTAVHIMMQAGKGKRPAMAEALRAIMARHPPPGSQVILMDGDSLLGPRSLARTCAVLAACPKVGAVTTDNVPLVKGSALTREWYRVRMAHRDSLMASISLSRKLLVLTGRFSVFRAEVAATPGFVQALARDVIEHPRLGRIEMVTGDDKSTWFETLCRGWQMLYVPDVVIHPVEELPDGGFLRATTALMLRWYGNMARNNGRALALGPRRCGFFPWLCLLDQRLSMWTSLVGPTCAAALSLRHGHACLVYYALWVLVTRGLVCLAYFVTTGRLHPLFPLVLYYNQLTGAWIKIYTMFHPYRQKWTRQAAKGKATPGSGGFVRHASTPYMLATLGSFVLCTVLASGALRDGWRIAAPPGAMSLLVAPAAASTGMVPAHPVPRRCGTIRPGQKPGPHIQGTRGSACRGSLARRKKVDLLAVSRASMMPEILPQEDSTESSVQ